MRLSSKYFRVRTALVISPLMTLVLVVLNCFIVSNYLYAEPAPARKALWLMLGMIVLNIFFGFIAVVSYKTYIERFWKGDKAVWKNSKWRFIKRFLFET